MKKQYTTGQNHPHREARDSEVGNPPPHRGQYDGKERRHHRQEPEVRDEYDAAAISVAVVAGKPIEQCRLLVKVGEIGTRPGLGRLRFTFERRTNEKRASKRAKQPPECSASRSVGICFVGGKIVLLRFF